MQKQKHLGREQVFKKPNEVKIPMPHLFIISYGNDAERKRIEYLLEKWSERAEISKLRGITFIIDTENVSEFAEELLSKLDPPSSDKVEVYHVKKEDLKSKVAPNKVELEYITNENPQIVRKLLRYILSKCNAYYVSSDDLSMTYGAYTKKGRVEIRIEIDEKSTNETQIVISLVGYGEVVEYMAKKLREELSLLL
ncbi:hypothetical protein [Palaeococcus pacificus]|nr:hypothetical protein [Palaeococcus pacificus]